VLGHKEETGGERKLYSEEVHNLHCSPDISPLFSSDQGDSDGPCIQQALKGWEIQRTL
jgi:hypothetical protein